MLSKEQDERLTRVGPGMPMGEDFALWTTPQGGYGIMQEQCPHGAASLIYGVVEEGGLRCGYHGRKFDFPATASSSPRSRASPPSCAM